jgi:hypothetical protein
MAFSTALEADNLRHDLYHTVFAQIETWWKMIYEMLLSERPNWAHEWGAPISLARFGYGYVTTGNVPSAPLRAKLESVCALLGEFIRRLAAKQPSSQEAAERRRILREVVTTKLSEGETARRREMMDGTRAFGVPSAYERKWTYDTYAELNDHDAALADGFGSPDDNTPWDERLRRLRRILDMI